MVVHDAIEFVISKRAVSNVFDTLEKRVNYLFDVFLSRASDEFDSVHDQLWLKLEGKSECRERAKEYIIAVCSPETKKEVVFQNGIKKDQLRKKMEEVEQLYCASLTLNVKERKIHIGGSRIAVALAASSLEETICIFEDNISSVPDAVVKSGDQTNSCDNSITPGTNSSVCERPKIPSNLVNTSSGQERAPTEGRLLECADTSSKTMREDVIHRELAEESLNDAKSEPDESSESVNDCLPASTESIRDFAMKLGYSEMDIDCALGKLGHMADKNSLLDELLKRNASVKQLEDGSCATVEKIIPTVEDADCLRSIAIDGSNVAMSHGNQRVFSCRGIGIAVDWFLRRGHKDIKVFVPLWRKESPRPDKPITDQEVMNRLEQDRFLVWTPSRKVEGRRITCYDDRYVIRRAVDTDGVIVSNDTFRDLLNESSEWKRCIEQRLLMYSFVNDIFMPPDDPLGRHGPVLDEFLRKGCGKLCPYGQRCTYGNRCKFLHPERNSKSEDQMLGAMAAQRTEQSLQMAPEVPYGNVQRPPRPLPPPPDMPRYLLSKPLPLPPRWEIHQRVTSMFPATLRSSPMGSERPISDPLPYSQELPPEVRQMHENFQRTSSMPCFESTQPCSPVPVAAAARQRSVSQIPEGYVTARSSHSTIQAYNTSPPHPDIVARGMPPIQRVVPSNARPPTDGWLPGDAFGAARYQQYPPHYPPIPARQPHSVPNSHWGVTPYSQQQYQQHPAPPHYQYSTAYYSGNQRVPYRGQSNGYFRPRAPPIIGCGDDDSDLPGEDASETELRIRAYEKLLEIFPDDGEKILKVMDDHPEVTSIEELTTFVVEEEGA